MKMGAQTVRWLLFLVLMKCFLTETYPAMSFELSPKTLTAKERSCVKITCHIKSQNTKLYNSGSGAYWFWMKDAKWNGTAADFDATIIYSTDISKRPVSQDFVNRVNYTEFAPSRNNLQKIVSEILICDLRKKDSGKYSFRYVGTAKWATNDNVIVTVKDNPCPLTFVEPPAVNESDMITLTCSTSSSCPDRLQIKDVTQTVPVPVQQSRKMTNITATFQASWRDDGKVFSCDTDGNEDTYLTRNVSITVAYGPKDVLAKIPENIREGDSVTLNCSAKGRPQPTQFTWFKDQVRQQFTGAEWKISSIQPLNSGEYYCEAENIHGKNSSQLVTIDVTYKPEVDIKGNQTTFNEGDQMDLICDVKRSNPKPASYTWFQDGNQIDLLQIYHVLSVKPENRGRYTCRATNIVGDGTSKPLEINVLYSPRNTNIVTFGHGKEYRLGESLKMTCKTDANPPPHSYFWTKHDSSKSTSSSWMETGNDDHDFGLIERKHEACYTCNATNNIGTGYDSEQVCIKVKYPPTKPKLSMPDEINEGQTITIECSVESYPDSSLTLTRTSTSEPFQEPRGDNYLINTIKYKFNVTYVHADSYICSAFNSEGSSESTQRKLVVKYAPKNVRINAEPGVIVMENGSLTLHCNAEAYPNVTSINWMRVTDGKEEYIQTSPKLTRKAVSPSDSGFYRCTATNDVGTGQSQKDEIKVEYAPKYANIIMHAKKQERDGRSSVTLTCVSVSYPPVKNYTWYWKKNGEKNYVHVSNKLNHTVYSDKPGLYYCTAENQIDKTSSVPVPLFARDIMMILILFFICLSILLLLLFLVMVFRHKRKKSIQQLPTNTHSFFGSLGWGWGWSGTRMGDLMNENILAEPFRGREELLLDQPCRPMGQHHQLRPDSTPTSNISTVYSTVNLPHTNQAPTRQQGGHTQDPSLNYASLHFQDKKKNKKAKVQEEPEYTKVLKPAKVKKEEKTTGDYENITAAYKSPNILYDDSSTSEDEVEVNYSQVSFKAKPGQDSSTSEDEERVNYSIVNVTPKPIEDSSTSEDEEQVNYSQVSFTPKPGHQRASRDSSSSDENEIEYSDVKM